MKRRRPRRRGSTPRPRPSPKSLRFLRSDGTTVKELADALEHSVDLTIPDFSRGIGRIDQSSTSTTEHLEERRCLRPNKKQQTKWTCCAKRTSVPQVAG